MLAVARENPEIAKKVNSAIFPGIQGGPLMHVIAAKAVAFREALEPTFQAYQQQVIDNARAMAATFLERGFNIVSGGTDNHLMLVDLIGRELTGKAADKLLGEACITVNKNAVPNDPRSPFVTSGIRVGTPAVTTRGFAETEVRAVAGWMCDLMEAPENEALVRSVRTRVNELCARFPVYGERERAAA